MPFNLIVTGCQKLASALSKVLAALPTAGGIASSILSVLSAFVPGLGEYAPLITQAVTLIKGGLTELESLLAQYQNDLASAPAGTIGKADAALGVIQSNLDQITAYINTIAPNVLNAAARGAIAAAVGGVESILLALTPYLSKAPAATKAQMPHASAMVWRKPSYQFVSAKDCALRHNAAMSTLGFPNAVVAVPK